MRCLCALWFASAACLLGHCQKKLTDAHDLMKYALPWPRPEVMSAITNELTEHTQKSNLK